MMTQEEKQQEKARLVQRQRAERSFDRKRMGPTAKSRVNDTDRAFKTWLKGRLDEIFDADR